MKLRGQVARFNSMYEEYIKNPDVTKRRMFYEAMEDILPGLEVIIDGSDGSTEDIADQAVYIRRF